MSITNVKQEVAKAPNPAQDFRNRSTSIASALLKDWVGESRAREATGRIATALSASAASAKNPKDFYDCTPQSVARVIAISALTGIMVGSGQGALAYAIPRRPRKGEPPQLQYQLSHRGIAALARRAGSSIVPIPIGIRDTVRFDECGEMVVDNRDIDNPPATEAELRGILILVKNLSTGAVVARGFVPKSIINKRREGSDSYKYAEKPGNEWAKESDPWHKWYVEMAIKTAMHYAIGRGWCVIDDTEAVRALQVDAEDDYEQVAIGLDDKTATQKLAERLGATADPSVIDSTATPADTVDAESSEADDTNQANDPQDA